MKKGPPIEEQLENIVFDKDNLNRLKEALRKTRTGKLTLNELGKKILEFRADILKVLIDFVPFHLKQTYTNNTLKDFTNEHSNTNQLEIELKEKDQLLGTLGTRLNKILENLTDT